MKSRISLSTEGIPSLGAASCPLPPPTNLLGEATQQLHMLPENKQGLHVHEHQHSPLVSMISVLY